MACLLQCFPQVSSGKCYDSRVLKGPFMQYSCREFLQISHLATSTASTCAWSQQMYGRGETCHQSSMP